MTAGPAWPWADENSYRDRAVELRATLASLSATCEQWERERAGLFNDVWSGDAATAAAAEVDRRTAAMHTLKYQLSTAATTAENAAAVITAVKTQVTENVHTAQSIIEQIEAIPDATAGEKSNLIIQVVAATRAANVAAVAAGAAELGAPVAGKPLNFGPRTPAAPGSLAPPEDPAAFRDWWNALSQEQKDAAFASDPNIGNHDGMPSAARDRYGKLNLADQLAKAQAAADRADALRAQHPDWAADHSGGADAGYQNESGYDEWKSQYDAATHDARHLPDLKAVDEALRLDPNRTLLLLDTESGSQVRAAIAVGNPDTADHVSVTTPGLNTTVHGAIKDMAGEAGLVREEALRQLQVNGRRDETVSTIAWIGYDPPQIAGDDLRSTLAGVWGVTQDDLARSGAHDLAGFYDGIRAVHQGPLDLTAIGHSYGSLTTGLALQEPGDHGVGRALFYGSPGIEAATPAQLNLQPGQVFTMATPDDRVVQGVYGAKSIAPAIPIIGPYLTDNLGDFGPNPATNPNFTRLETSAITIPEPGGSTVVLQDAHGHSDYPRFPDGGGVRTTNFNIAAVIAGTNPIEDE
jgi:hypothetical protein